MTSRFGDFGLNVHFKHMKEWENVYLHVTNLHVAKLFHIAKKPRDPINKKE